MNTLPLLRLVALSVAGLMCGCVSAPEPEGQLAYDIGDRTQVALDEVIVSLPFKGSSQPYQNLHVGLAATMNPLKATVSGAYSKTDVAQRLEPRISSRLVEFLSGMKAPAISDMQILRGDIARQAQAVVDEAMQRWQHGSEYEIKILVVSLYWTDASVGRATTSRRSWW